MTQTLESLTLFSNQAPVVATIARPAPTRETEYLERIEATLAEAEDGPRHRRSDAHRRLLTQKNTTLAVSVVIPCLQRTRHNRRDRPPGAGRQMHSEILHRR